MQELSEVQRDSSYDLFIIDTDAGVDDALCLTLAAKLIPASKLLVSSVFGNVEVEQASKNVGIIFANMGLALPYMLQGAAAAKDGYFRSAKHIHGNDGLGGVTSSFKQANTEIIPIDGGFYEWSLRKSTNKVKILSIGPATNIPTYIKTIGSDKISDITLMTGVFFDVGNIEPYAEFNLYCDPFAFNEVTKSSVRVNIVPLDLCRKVIFEKSRISVLKKYGSISDILIPAHEHYMDNYNKWEGIEGCYPHDGIALLVSLFPELFVSVPMEVEAATRSEARGELIKKSIVSKSNVHAFLGGRLKIVRELFNTNEFDKTFGVERRG